MEKTRCRRCGRNIEQGYELCPECARKMHDEWCTDIRVKTAEAERLEEASKVLGTTIANIVEWLVEENLDELVRQEGALK